VIRAVLDANTIVSGLSRFRSETSPPALILRAWTFDFFELLISDSLIDEVVRTLSKPYFAERVDPELHRATLEALRNKATRVDLTETATGVATHPEDDLVIAAALSAKASFLVTGDRQLQRLGHVGNVAILDPRAFYTVLDDTVLPK
jgi:putative PIN family toxin of toxin-antitoxin system